MGRGDVCKRLRGQKLAIHGNSISPVEDLVQSTSISNKLNLGQTVGSHSERIRQQILRPHFQNHLGYLEYCSTLVCHSIGNQYFYHRQTWALGAKRAGFALLKGDGELRNSRVKQKLKKHNDKLDFNQELSQSGEWTFHRRLPPGTSTGDICWCSSLC